MKHYEMDIFKVLHSIGSRPDLPLLEQITDELVREVGSCACRLSYLAADLEMHALADPRLGSLVSDLTETRAAALQLAISAVEAVA